MLAKPRLNVFAFPSNTTSRFVLLLIAIIGATMFVFSELHYSIPLHRESRLVIVERCTQLASSTPSDSLAKTLVVNYYPCIASFERQRVGWMVGGAVAVIGLGLFGYIIWVERRKRQLTRLEPIDDPDILPYLNQLCHEAELPKPPIFLLDTVNDTEAQVFGWFNHYYVALHLGTGMLFHTNRAEFRAIIMHELAHIRNGDVDKFYLVLASFASFLIVTPVVIGVTLILGSRFSNNLELALRILLLGIVVFLSLMAVVRSREFYADVRASTYAGVQTSLASIATQKILSTPEFDTFCNQLKARFENLIRRFIHPSAQQRRTTLENPHLILALTIWDVFSIGFTTTLSQSIISEFALFLLWNPANPLTMILILALAMGVTYLWMAWAVGANLWAMRFASWIQPHFRASTGLIGLGLGVGLIAGQYGALINAPLGQSAYGLSGMMLFQFDILWILVLLTSTCFFVQWLSSSMETWILAVTTQRSMQRIAIFISMIALVPLVIWGTYLVSTWYIRMTIQLYPLDQILSEFQGDPAITEMFALLGTPLTSTILIAVLVVAVIGVFLVSPLTLIMVHSFWLLPMMSWFWIGTRRTLQPSPWMVLEPNSFARIPLRFSAVTPRFAVRVAIGGALLFIFCIAALTTLVYILSGFSAFLVYWVIGGPVLLATFGAIPAVALWITFKTPVFGWIHGLFGAFIAGGAISLVLNGLILFVFHQGAQEIADIEFRNLILEEAVPLLVWFTTSLIMTLGGILALGGSLVLSLLLFNHRETSAIIKRI